MKKYPKMTFAALSAIALNFSCLATSHPLQHPDNKGTHNNIPSRHPTHLSAGEQISLLKNAITESNRTLAENILTGHMRKIGPSYYYRSNAGRFFAQMSDPQFEELQLFSLEDLKASPHCGQPFYDKRKIFEMITAKFFEVTDNKEQAYQMTASEIYPNLDSFGVEEFRGLVGLIPSPEGKRAFARQLLNDAKQANNIGKYDDIFSKLDNFPGIESIFTNQLWLQPFISEYLEQALSDTTDINLEDMPIGFIKEAAPALYNNNFPALLEKCITESAPEVIDTLLPIDEDTSLPLEDRRLSSKYLNLALEGYHGIDTIASYIASYTDTSSDLTNVAQTLTSFTQEERQETLECIKDANSVLYQLLLKEDVQSFWKD